MAKAFQVRYNLLITMIGNPERHHKDRMSSPENKEQTLHFSIKPAVQEPDSEPSRTQRDKVRSACVIARHPGAGVYFSPIIEDFIKAGVEVHVIATEHSAMQLRQLAQQREYQIVTQTSTPVVEWGLVSGDHPTTFEATQLKQLKLKNPDLHLVIAEDSPGSVTNMIKELVEQEIYPTLVTTTTRDQATLYRELLAKLTPDNQVMVVPIGQPAFDNLKENYQALRQPTREKLIELASLSEFDLNADKVVAFMGIPETDFPALSVPSNAGTEYLDLNSTALHQALQTVSEIARHNSNIQYYFIYKPHPRSKELQNHPYLELFRQQTNSPTNLTIAYYTKEALQQAAITTQALTAAADLVINTLSTIGQELGVVKAQTQDIELPSSILLLPQDYFIAYQEQAAQLAQQAQLSTTTLELYQGALKLERAGAAKIISKPDHAVGVMSRVLTASATEQADIHKHNTLAYQYRLHAPAAAKMLRWMRATQSPRTRSNSLFS